MSERQRANQRYGAREAGCGGAAQAPEAPAR